MRQWRRPDISTPRQRRQPQPVPWSPACSTPRSWSAFDPCHVDVQYPVCELGRLYNRAHHLCNPHRRVALLSNNTRLALHLGRCRKRNGLREDGGPTRPFTPYSPTGPGLRRWARSHTRTSACPAAYRGWPPYNAGARPDRQTPAGSPSRTPRRSPGRRCLAVARVQVDALERRRCRDVLIHHPLPHVRRQPVPGSRLDEGVHEQGGSPVARALRPTARLRRSRSPSSESRARAGP